MIRFLVTGPHRYTLEHVRTARRVPRIDVTHYEDLVRIKRLASGTYIFTDLDRLSHGELEEASRLYQLLLHAGVKVLNNPARVKTRYPLLRALRRAGLNDFDVYRASDLPTQLRYPVFVRKDSGHGRPLTDLLQGEAELSQAIDAAVAGGICLDRLMVIEYAGEPVRRGQYRKLAAFKIGDAIVPHFSVNDRTWLVKGGFPDPDIEDLYLEERIALETNPYEAHLARVFDVAQIEYGRADFGFYQGRIQVFEINTNPQIPLPCAHPSKTRVGNMEIAWEKYLDALARVDSPAGPSVKLADTSLPAHIRSTLNHDSQRQRRHPTLQQQQQRIKWWWLRAFHRLQDHFS